MKISNISFLFFLWMGFVPATMAQIQYVNPFIGTGGHGHTFPGATTPFGMVQLSPDTRISMQDWDGCSGYHFSDSLIYGFSHTHLSGTGVPDYGDILFMPFTSGVRLEPDEYAATFSKTKEKAEAGYYSVFLDHDRILCRLTATERVGVHRYTFPPNRERGSLLIDLRHRDEVLESHLEVLNDRELAGYRVSKSWASEQRVYFVVRFSQPVTSSIVLDMSKNPRVAEPSVTSKAIVGLFNFINYPQNPLVVTVGISGVSIEGARKNLEAECNHFDFDRVKQETQAKWQQKLSKIEVSGGRTEQKTIFYTALYHTMVVPNLWSDVDGQYRGRDKQIHQASGHPMYTVFSLWDTYRACNPLYTILEPARTNDFVQTFLRQYEQGGLLPIWELSANETDCMIGNHAIPVIADAYAKGIRNYDLNFALTAMQKSALQDRYGMKWYRELGFIPSDKEAESVSKTLEYAYDDWCIANMAKSMGKQDVYQIYIRRAQNFKNLYDPSTGFFRARANGSWCTPFDPFEVNFNYTEANAWQYRFAAPQDISGMIALAGGKPGFVKALDDLFNADSKTTGRTQADITGLIGQYVQGNEPSHHIAYLYAAAGKSWKTQERVRQIMDNMYHAQPDGLSGNEDCGQMSAWYVFSAMGFYPLTPGNPSYVIGTPLFDKITLHLDGGKQFEIRSAGASASNCYIQQGKLNGLPMQGPFFGHEQLLQGGSIELEMGNKPAEWTKQDFEQSISENLITPVPFVSKGERVFIGEQMIELGCLDPQADIFYGVLPEKSQDIAAVSGKKYLGPITVKNSGKLFFYAEKERQQSARVIFQFHQINPSAKVQYNAPYNNQYTARGELGLIDGIRGGTDFRTGDWQGFEGVSLDVVLDLGKKQKVSKVSAGFLQDENAWIFFPTEMRVEISEDGATFEPAGTVACDVPQDQKGVILKEFTLKIDSKKVRYVKITGVTPGKCPHWHKGAGSPCWIFADEISVE